MSDLFVDVFKVGDMVIYFPSDICKLAGLDCLSCGALLWQFGDMVDLLLVVQDLWLNFVDLGQSLRNISFQLDNFLLSLLLLLCSFTMLLHQNLYFVG